MPRRVRASECALPRCARNAQRNPLFSSPAKRVRNSSNRPFADMLTIADRLDAATDSLGRPYRQSKSIDSLIGEFQAGPGTRYGPETDAALSVPEVSERLQYLITEGREEICYRVSTSGTV